MRLDDILVLDLTRLLPGPYATQLLADMGADVVKVEDTRAGDYARATPPTTDRDVGAMFDAINRGKRSVALDLKSDEGREAFYRLAREADVIFEQFRPGVVERLGVDYETVREHNPGIVYCSLSGYGGTGPYVDRAGHDLNYIGRAGLLDMTREDEDAKPQMPGYQVADLGGGLFAAFGIVGALLSRELGDGTGEYVDVGMADVVLSFSHSVSTLAVAGQDPRPGETPLTGGYPWYDTYRTADDRWVTIGALEPQFWDAFCAAIGREDLVEYHMTEDEAELAALREELSEIFASRTRDEWVDAMADVDACVDGVFTVREALEDEGFAARGLVKHGEYPSRVGFPAVADLPEADESVPLQGQHTDEILEAVGYSEAELASMRESDAIR